MPSVLRSPRFWLQFCLWFALVFGLGCRFYGLNWDESTGLHPDERFCSGIVPRLAWPSSVGEWFDSAKNPFNPSNLVNDKGERDTHYVYGQLPLIIAKAVMGKQTDPPEPTLIVRAVKVIQGKKQDENVEALPILRGLSAFFDCLTVLISLLIARRLLGPRWGLFAGALVSLAALNVQQSHYFTTDTFAATFMTLAFWNGARWLDTRKWFDVLGLGFWFGCSLACKLSSAFFAVAWLGFVLLAWRRYGAKRVLPLALCSFLLSFWTFRIFHPMMFMGTSGIFDLHPDTRFLSFMTNEAIGPGGQKIFTREWIGDFGQQLGITSGEVDVPFNVQWVGRKPWLFSLVNLGWWGFGWPLLLAGISGGVWALRRPKKVPVLVIATLFVVVSLGVQGAQFSKFTRYFLPLTPMFALLAAFFWRELLIFKPRMRPAVAAALAYSFSWCLAVTGIYGRPNTRLEASRWVIANIPAGSHTIAETSWDEGLPIWGFYPPNGSYKDQRLESYDLDTPKKRAQLEDALNNGEWLFITSGRSWQNIPRWPQKWPMMTEFYRALFNGELGFDKVQEFTSYPGIGPFRIPDYNLEEALNVYDHPRVMIFHKRSTFSPENVDRILSAAPLPTTDQFHPRDAPGQWDSLPQPQ
ncbi:hypothetical protein IAD21_02631 [Abditibacteriota bacterium]|nr:hypothetical protein IAD21_02631 [Abditibacteriota bacterium]